MMGAGGTQVGLRRDDSTDGCVRGVDSQKQYCRYCKHGGHVVAMLST